jgi:DNA-binding transcriptional MerR regulator
MAGRDGEAWGKHASVTVEAAARLVDVDVESIRHWSDIGSLVIERRGDMDVVRLDQVRALTSSPKRGERAGTGYGALRALLRDAAEVESLNVSGLQQMVREKAGKHALGSTR